MNDTIAAISTPIGTSGIGIVRLSGSKAFEIVAKVFKSPKAKIISDLPTFSVHYGHIIDPQTEEIIDEVLLMLYRAPYTYTREDVVEISCHGGIVPLKRTLELVLRCGARLAEPGEFTKRAFLNGRIDLSQAEAVADVVRAKTEASLKVAMDQLRGKLSQKIKGLRNELIDIMAHIEAGIDFPGDEVGELSKEELRDRLGGILSELVELLGTADRGKVLREGISAVIVGRPNVGKSSLLNALLRESRAIVTEIPGTTRDTIEEITNIKGVPIKTIDTAGMREVSDVIEKLGVERTRRMIELADLVLLVLDSSEELTEADINIIEEVKGKPVIVVFNKIDLATKLEEKGLRELLPGSSLVKTAIIYDVGLAELEDEIAGLVFSGGVVLPETTYVTNIRHKDALEWAKVSLEKAVGTVDAGLPEDLVAIDLRDAADRLGEITGETVTEDVLERIFSQFCIGK